MSGIRGMMKDGWHPKGNDGAKESWRGDFKGINQVAGWVGMGKGGSDSADKVDHVSRPLSSLKDPASFGPPPKHVHYHGPAGVAERTTPDRRGSGAPLSPQATPQPEAASKPAPPPLPYRRDRTGLSTEDLPPPPVRRDSPIQAGVSPVTKPKPNVPPRLPARKDSGIASSPSPPPYSERESPAQLNQGAISRLGQAGISVPRLGIGRPDSGERRDTSPSTPTNTGTTNHFNQLQSRFSKLSTAVPPSPKSPGNPQSPQSPANGTTLGEKQAALRTAQNFHKDPSSVSVSQARSAASTVNNFRERHSDHIEAGKNHIEAGKKKLNAINQKYGITKRINDFIEDQTSPAQPAPQAQPGQSVPPPPPPHPNLTRSSSNVDLEALNRRKPPPPPPPAKKPQLQSTPVHAASPSPPPLPLGTKPR